MLMKVLRAICSWVIVWAVLACVTLIVVLSLSPAIRDMRAGMVVHNVDLPAGRKLVGVTWKDGEPWALTRSATVDETVGEVWELESKWSWRLGREVYRFKERPVPVRDAGVAP
jgi:hypothetical protein